MTKPQIPITLVLCATTIVDYIFLFGFMCTIYDFEKLNPFFVYFLVAFSMECCDIYNIIEITKHDYVLDSSSLQLSFLELTMAIGIVGVTYFRGMVAFSSGYASVIVLLVLKIFFYTKEFRTYRLVHFEGNSICSFSKKTLEPFDDSILSSKNPSIDGVVGMP